MEETMQLPDGTLLQGGKFRILRSIGSGGFGCTYEAVHTVLGRHVAVKEFFMKDFCNRDETTAHVTVGTVGKKALVEKLRHKFIDEARALAQVEHPNIVRVLDVFEENDTAYFVMDYVDGVSLAEMVKYDGSLPEVRALKYIRQVAYALKCVHAHNRLHLDVKPGNIMINSHDDAVLIDFGASKQYDEENGENNSTLIGHTEGYAPIEQYGDTIVKFTPATDIYALGATLYKLLTGITPPSSNLLAGDTDLEPLPSAISKPTADAIHAAMEIKKSRRPQTVDEFLAILNGSVVSDAKPKQKQPSQVEERSEVTVLDDSIATEAGKAKKARAGKVAPVHKTEKAGEAEEMQNPEELRKRKKAKKTTAFDNAKKKTKTKKILIWIGSSVCVAAIVTVILILALRPPYAYVSSATGTIEGREYVDLGLSVKWARYNVGAFGPSGYGDYYAWGETTTKTSYITFKKDMESIAGDTRYDAARANWGGTWRLPTKEEIDELIEKCRIVWTRIGSIRGYKVTGPNGNSIFLPGAGERVNEKWAFRRGGFYWSATPADKVDESSTWYAIEFGFFPRTFIHCHSSLRSSGYSVRAVSE